MNKRNYKVYIQFLYPFFISILISFVFFIILYITTLNSVGNLEYEYNYNQLQNSITNLQNEMETFDLINEQIISNYTIENAVVSDDDEKMATYLEYYAMSNLVDSKNMSSYIISAMIFAEQTGRVITSFTTNDLDTFYGNAFEINGCEQDDIYTYLEEISSSDKNYVCVDVVWSKFNLNVILMVESEYIGGLYTYIVYLIDYDTFYDELLNPQNVDWDVKIYDGTDIFYFSDEEITEEDKYIIEEINSQTTISGEIAYNENYICYVKDYSTGMLFYTVRDNDTMFAVQNTFVRIIVINVLIMIALSVIMLAIYKKHNINPSIQILNKAGVANLNKNVFQHIGEKYTSLEEEKSALMQEYTENEKQIFEYKLFNSKFENKQEIYNLAQNLGINLNLDNEHIVFLCNLDLEENYSNIEIRQKIKEILKESFMFASIYSFSYEYDINELALVCFFGTNQDKQTYLDICTSTTEYIETNFPVELKISISLPIQNLENVLLTVENLKRLMINKSYEFVDGVILYDENYFEIGDMYKFSSEDQAKFINIIRNGTYAQVKEMFNLVYSENILNRHLNVYTARVFFIDLLSTFYKMEEEYIKYDWLKKRLEILSRNIFNMNELSLIQEIANVIKDLSDAINNESAEENEDVIELIKNKIDNNFENSEISVNEVMTNLDYSYSYISVHFKNTTGKTISEYIDFKRTEKAKELLKNTSLNIKTISEKCGYNSPLVFSRNFKKHTGLTPTDYKNK